MYDVGVRITALASIALLAACASAPPDEFALGRAKHYYAAGNLDAALRYSDLAIQRAPNDPRSDEIALHLEILRSAGRDEEARAVEELAARLEAGEDIDSAEAHPTRTECFKMMRALPKSMRLVRSYREIRYGDARWGEPLDIGDTTTTYQIDASGEPINIRVVRAGNPAAAWTAIGVVADVQVLRSRLEKLDPSAFPIDYCLYSNERLPSVGRTKNR